MSKQSDGGPAFPAMDDSGSGAGPCLRYEGMSLRDYFAAKAMQVLLPQVIDEHARAMSAPTTANRDVRGRSAEEQTRRGCEAAYQIADAMLKARNA